MCSILDSDDFIHISLSTQIVFKIQNIDNNKLDHLRRFLCVSHPYYPTHPIIRTVTYNDWIQFKYNDQMLMSYSCNLTNQTAIRILHDHTSGPRMILDRAHNA